MQKKDNLIINSNKKVFNNVLGDLSRDQNQVVKFNKEKAYKLLDQVKASLKEGKNKLIFEDVNGSFKKQYEYDLSYAKEVLISLSRKKLINDEDLKGLDI